MCGSGQLELSPIAGLLALVLVLPAFLWYRRARLGDERTWLGVAAIVYLNVLLSLTFLPLPLPPYEVVEQCPYVYLQPFATIGPALRDGLASPAGRFLVGNVLAFMPLGLLLPVLRHGARPLAAVVVGGLLLSLSIEAGQLVASLVVGYPYRQADVDDVIVNTLGAAAGYGLLVALRQLNSSGRPTGGPVR